MGFPRYILAAALLLAFGLARLAGETLGLDKARTLALAQSKTLQKTGLAADAALLAEKAVFYDSLPAVSASASGAFSYSAAKTNLADMLSASVGVSASYRIYDGGANAVLAAIDRLATAAARQSARAAYFNVLDSVDAAYYAALEAQASLEAAQSGMAAARQALEIARIKLEAGMITKVDLIQVESQMAVKETALSQARRNLAVNKAKVASLTGEAAAFELEPVDFFRYEALLAKAADYGDAASDSLTAAVAKAAYAANPTLARYAAAGDKARLAVDQAATGYYPTVSAAFSHKLSVGSAGFDATSGGLSVSVSVPIDWWKTDNEVKAADASAKQAALDLDEQRRSLDLDVLTAVADCVAQARSVQSSRKALEYAESNYANILELYRLSSKPVADLLDAEASVSAGKGNLITARYGFLSRLSALRSLGAFESYEALLALFP